jgi:hypothetical protein
VSRIGAPSFERVLTAMATNESVAACLSCYPDRDEAIAQLQADVERQRHDLVRELRALARASSAASVAARIQRDAILLGARDV